MLELAKGKAASTPNMRVTRARTGKLPTPVSRAGFVTEYEDDGSPPASPSRKKTTTKVAQEPSKVPVEVVEAEPAEAVDVKEEEPAPIFVTIESKLKIPAGLSIIRPIPGGYEIVALKDINFKHISSQATGTLLKGDTGRHGMLSVSEKDWELGQFACAQAIRSADKEIFRIDKLPLELRLMIYEFALVSDKPLRHYYNIKNVAPTLALNLMLTSKVMLKETRPIFYKNSFQIPVIRKGVTPEVLVVLRDHLKEATFNWEGYVRTESSIFKFLDSCPNFKILNLQVNDWSVKYTQRRSLFRPSMVSMGAIKNFVSCPGIDRISGIKGLEKIRVVKNDWVALITDAEMKALRDYLTPLVTKPKYVRPPKPVKVAPTPRVKKGKKTKKTKNWHNDPDFDSEYDG